MKRLSVLAFLAVVACGPVPPPTPPTPPPPTPPAGMQPLAVKGNRFVPDDLQGATRTACGWPFVTLPHPLLILEHTPRQAVHRTFHGTLAATDSCLQQIADRKLNWTHFRLPFVVTDDPARQAYVLVNGKSDLNHWNDAFFTWLDQLYGRAESLGIYVEQDLIDGWWLKHTDIPGHSWRAGNNVQGVDVGYCSDTQVAPHQYAIAYVRKIAQIAAKHNNVHAQDGNELMFCNPSQAWIAGLKAAWDDELAKAGAGKRLFGTNALFSGRDDSIVKTLGLDYVSYHQNDPPPARPWPVQINEIFPIDVPNRIRLIRNCRQTGVYCQGWSDDEPGIGGWPEAQEEWIQLLDRIKDLRDHPCKFPINTDKCDKPVPPSQTLGDYGKAVSDVQTAHPDWFNGNMVLHSIDAEPVGRIYRQRLEFAVQDALRPKFCSGVTEPGIEISKDGVWIDEYAPIQQTDGTLRPAANAYRNHCQSTVP